MNAATGASPGAGIPSTLAVPTSKLDSLANALTSCTGVGGIGSCTALLSAAASGSTVPTDTLDAALNIARAPANNVTAIYALAAGSAVFSPALAAAPSDWMLHNTISGGGINVPASVGVDASGNVWVSSYFNAVSEFSPNGAAVFPAGITGSGINESYGMALDVQGNVWIANEQTTPNSGSGDVTELNSSGQPIATGITSGGIYFPIGVAADTNGNMWFADYGDSKVTLLISSGTAISSSAGWGGTSLAFPVALAVDASHNAWVANQGGPLPITKISADGSQVTNYNCDCNGASGVATDQSGNVWIANYYGNSISEVDTCGTSGAGRRIGRRRAASPGNCCRWRRDRSGWPTIRATRFRSLAARRAPSPGMFLSPASGFGTDASLLESIRPRHRCQRESSGCRTPARTRSRNSSEIAAPVKTPLAGPPQSP